MSDNYFCGCWNCEYGDYDKQSKENICNLLIDGKQIELSDEIRAFIDVMGCGRWHWVTDGNPRAYSPGCIGCQGYNPLRIPAECEFKGHHVSEERCIKGCKEFEQRK